MTTATVERAHRQTQARQLRAEGLSFAAIARSLGISKTQAYTDVQAPISETVIIPTGADSGDSINWPAVESGAVILLQQQAERGSVPASRELVRLARDETAKAMALRCEDHVTFDESTGLLLRLWDRYLSSIRDALPRHIAQRYDLPYAEVQAMFQEALDGVYSAFTSEDLEKTES